MKGQNLKTAREWIDRLGRPPLDICADWAWQLRELEQTTLAASNSVDELNSHSVQLSWEDLWVDREGKLIRRQAAEFDAAKTCSSNRPDSASPMETWRSRRVDSLLAQLIDWLREDALGTSGEVQATPETRPAKRVTENLLAPHGPTTHRRSDAAESTCRPPHVDPVPKQWDPVPQPRDVSRKQENVSAGPKRSPRALDQKQPASFESGLGSETAERSKLSRPRTNRRSSRGTRTSQPRRLIAISLVVAVAVLVYWSLRRVLQMHPSNSTRLAELAENDLSGFGVAARGRASAENAAAPGNGERSDELSSNALVLPAEEDSSGDSLNFVDSQLHVQPTGDSADDAYGLGELQKLDIEVSAHGLSSSEVSVSAASAGHFRASADADENEQGGLGTDDSGMSAKAESSVRRDSAETWGDENLDVVAEVVALAEASNEEQRATEVAKSDQSDQDASTAKPLRLSASPIWQTHRLGIGLKVRAKEPTWKLRLTEKEGLSIQPSLPQQVRRGRMIQWMIRTSEASENDTQVVVRVRPMGGSGTDLRWGIAAVNAEFPQLSLPLDQKFVDRMQRLLIGLQSRLRLAKANVSTLRTNSGLTSSARSVLAAQKAAIENQAELTERLLEIVADTNLLIGWLAGELEVAAALCDGTDEDSPTLLQFGQIDPEGD